MKVAVLVTRQQGRGEKRKRRASARESECARCLPLGLPRAWSMRCLTSFATPSSLMGGGWPLAGETDAESGAALAPALDTDAPEGGVAAAEAPLCEDDGVVVAVVGADAAGGLV